MTKPVKDQTDLYEHLRRQTPATELATAPAAGKRILVAVSSCWKDLVSNQNIRATWGANLPEGWDLRFFLGSHSFTEEEQSRLFTPEWIGSPGTLGNLAAATARKATIGKASDLKPDELLLDCPDDYLGLPWKTVESLKYALAEGYDGVFRVFVDTYLFPDRLARIGFPSDAIGWLFGCGPCKAHETWHHTCPLGGAGYWLSRKAIEAVLYYNANHLKPNSPYSTKEVTNPVPKRRVERPITHWGL
jgi:hypothetical protein